MQDAIEKKRDSRRMGDGQISWRLEPVNANGELGGERVVNDHHGTSRSKIEPRNVMSESSDCIWS